MYRPTLFHSRSQIHRSSDTVISVGSNAASPRMKNRRKSSVNPTLRGFLACVSCGGEGGCVEGGGWMRFVGLGSTGYQYVTHARGSGRRKHRPQTVLLASH